MMVFPNNANDLKNITNDKSAQLSFLWRDFLFLPLGNSVSRLYFFRASAIVQYDQYFIILIDR